MSATNKYHSFDDTYGSPTPLDLPPLKPGSMTEKAPPGTLDKEKVQGVITCSTCKKPRCVFVKTKLSCVRNGAAPNCTLKDTLEDAIEANQISYSCGGDLDLQGFSALSGTCRPYVRMKIDCSTHVEIQLYSSGVLPASTTDKICGFCGEDEGHPRDEDGEAESVLPVCQPCYDQHGKARNSRRQAARFDRGGNRRRNAENARRREGQAAQATTRREAATTAATTAATAAATATAGTTSAATTAAAASATATARGRPLQGVAPTAGVGTSEEDHPTTNRNVTGNKRTAPDSSDDEDGECSEESECSSDEEPRDYFVHAIHDVRSNSRRLEFLIEWKDFPEEDSFTWEPTKNLPNDKEMIKEFKAAWLEKGKSWPTTNQSAA